MGGRHLRRIVTGEVAQAATMAAVVTALLMALAWCGLRNPSRRSAIARTVAYFGVIWIALGLAPTLVAGYESPRHVYLASAGWAVTLGIAFDALVRASPVGILRTVAAAGGVVVLVVYAAQLRTVVQEWSTRAAVSRRAVADLEREVLAAPEGSLVLVGVSPRSWEWSLPFAARPPYAAEDLTKRATLIYPVLLHCCRPQWEAFTRAAIADWMARPGSRDVIALWWDEHTGRLSRRTGREEPYLRAVVEALPGVQDASALDRGIRGAIAVATLAPVRR
jgi:hypothetical protein